MNTTAPAWVPAVDDVVSWTTPITERELTGSIVTMYTASADIEVTGTDRRRVRVQASRLTLIAKAAAR